jgi:hypothetical protein
MECGEALGFLLQFDALKIVVHAVHDPDALIANSLMACALNANTTA